MTLWSSVLLLWVIAAIAMAAGWWWQRQRKNAGIVDVIWTAGGGFAAVLYASLLDGAPMIRGLLALLAGLWSARLALHVARRVFGAPEEGRYRQLRVHWRDNQLKMFLMFQFQALLIVLFSLPFLAVARNRVVDALWLGVAIALWLIGVAGESLADRQLARFRADPGQRGRTCRIGLWRYSRHPNYFFEWVQWFTYVALAVGAPSAWLAWLGPLLMFAFLRWISGIPHTEAQALRTRGHDYRDYQRRTSMFVPWFPKRLPKG